MRSKARVTVSLSILRGEGKRSPSAEEREKKRKREPERERKNKREKKKEGRRKSSRRSSLGLSASLGPLVLPLGLSEQFPRLKTKLPLLPRAVKEHPRDSGIESDAHGQLDQPRRAEERAGRRRHSEGRKTTAC